MKCPALVRLLHTATFVVLVKGNPGESITDTRRIVAIWKAGHRHEPARPAD